LNRFRPLTRGRAKVFCDSCDIALEVACIVTHFDETSGIAEHIMDDIKDAAGGPTASSLTKLRLSRARRLLKDIGTEMGPIAILARAEEGLTAIKALLPSAAPSSLIEDLNGVAARIKPALRLGVDKRLRAAARAVSVLDGLSQADKELIGQAVIRLAAASNDGVARTIVMAQLQEWRAQPFAARGTALDAQVAQWITPCFGPQPGQVAKELVGDWLALDADPDGPPPQLTLMLAVRDGVPTLTQPERPKTHVVARALIDRESGQHDALGQLRRFDVLEQPMKLLGDIEPNTNGKFPLIESLRAEFPWFAEVITFLEDHVLIGYTLGKRRYLRCPPILLAGPPGCGKSRFAMRLGEISGAGFGMLQLGGYSDNRMFQGTARGYSSAQASWPALQIVRLNSPNPVLIIDELDKCSRDTRNGGMLETLLGVTEPQTAANWNDDFLLTPLDLSMINWVFTANDLGQLPTTITSRINIFKVGMPGPDHYGALCTGMLQEIADEYEVAVEGLPKLDPRADAMLQMDFASNRCPRLLKRALKQALTDALRAGLVQH
jgi:hypothetical protein